MTTLQDAVALAQADRGLAVVSTLRADQTIQASLINAGIISHPATGEPVLAFVTYGPVKLNNLRARPQIALTFRSGWQWATVEGRAELAGPETQFVNRCCHESQVRLGAVPLRRHVARKMPKRPYPSPFRGVKS